ncbi:host attachment family protein [Pontixanthobacter gangjinensis]|uniref:Host attachment protein n=1 Tax=Pontixanthobacter gangjinensis TaxID=1028742 RepID=A0A6I4SNE3_9SPHN|nr:host attachment family protein [Pontixanthobacter gangjinensis]MXO57283.1 Host attachment protein [Pontixanthobacter gangjinensis]
MKIAHGTLVMAIDGGKMLLMRNAGDVPRPVLETIEEHTAENPRTLLQGTDRPGRSFSRSGPRRSAVGDTDWHEEGEQRFAIDAVDTLSETQAREGGAVIVLAAPSVLGTFRKHCPQALGKSIIAEIDKDVVNLATDDIVKVVTAYEP